MSSSNESIIAEYFSSIRAMDTERLMKTFATRAELHDPVGTPAKRGSEEIRTFFTQTFASFKLVNLTEEHVYACGSSVAVKWVGKAVGPSGKSCDFAGIDTFECAEDGKIATVRAFWDTQPVMALLES